MGIHDSTILPSASASAIEFGPVYGFGEVLGNVISADGGTGIRVYGSGIDDLVIQQNNVSGAQTAIRADYPANSVLFQSNVLTGDGVGGVHDIGICSDAAFNELKRNRIRQFDVDVQEGGCTPP